MRNTCLIPPATQRREYSYSIVITPSFPNFPNISQNLVGICCKLYLALIYIKMSSEQIKTWSEFNLVLDNVFPIFFKIRVLNFIV